MRRKYGDCQRVDGNCTLCNLVSYGRDCRNRPITKLEWHRLAAGMDLKTLSEQSGVHVRQIQRVESGESKTGNLTLTNAVALAKALGIEPEQLL